MERSVWTKPCEANVSGRTEFMGVYYEEEAGARVKAVLSDENRALGIEH